MVPQFMLTALGLTEILGTPGVWFKWLRWIGVAWMIWFGIARWRAPLFGMTTARPEPKSPRAIYVRALLVSLTNRRTLFCHGAFFPRLVTVSQLSGDPRVGARIGVA
jgi:homoserine/homoserine lactone efflux protein